jgi:hypothetical protein|uniref:Uncharacterized protein n=1 Tax=viral metagenome TaxID=1070528 RepID=A0A6C0DC67_9ZZZZ
MSLLSAFNTQLVNLFDELCSTFPEDKEIKMATEAIKGAKKINPRLILDLFVEHVYKECSTAVYERNAVLFRQIAQRKISNQFNEMISALSIFDKYWDTMGQKNQDVIWQYLKVLCILCEKATAQ